MAKSQSNKTFSTFRRFRAGAIVLLCTTIGVILLFCALAYLPHHTKQLHAVLSLQSGETFEVAATLQAKWPWSQPENLIDLQARIGGRVVDIPKRYFLNSGPFDPSSRPLLDEWKGYPLVTLVGIKDQSLERAAWWFQNFTFSALRQERSHQWSVTYYASSPTNLLTQVPKPAGDSNGVFVVADAFAVKTMPISLKPSSKGKLK